jgi:hypothetical protein
MLPCRIAQGRPPKALGVLSDAIVDLLDGDVNSDSRLFRLRSRPIACPPCPGGTPKMPEPYEVRLEEPFRLAWHRERGLEYLSS